MGSAFSPTFSCCASHTPSCSRHSRWSHDVLTLSPPNLPPNTKLIPSLLNTTSLLNNATLSSQPCFAPNLMTALLRAQVTCAKDKRATLERTSHLSSLCILSSYLEIQQLVTDRFVYFYSVLLLLLYFYTETTCCVCVVVDVMSRHVT